MGSQLLIKNTVTLVGKFFEKKHLQQRIVVGGIFHRTLGPLVKKNVSLPQSERFHKEVKRGIGIAIILNFSYSGHIRTKLQNHI